MATIPHVIGWDLGTSGCKALLLSAAGDIVAEADASYTTYHPTPGQREQEPNAWWDALAACTRKLLRQTRVRPSSVVGCGVSGHSLGVVPQAQDGSVLADRVPIWSDERAACEAVEFFERVQEHEWYLETGNGFPPHLYAVFKMMWFREHRPDVYDHTAVFLGTKDHVNFRLTGTCATDPSYASGSGLYSLRRKAYVTEYIEASGVPEKLIPNPVPAHEVIGCLSPKAAPELGLSPSTRVVAGGVDNACMALGARSHSDGRWYAAIGSSGWIAVSTSSPVLDVDLRPYVFAHVVPGQFTSALSMFSAGTSLQWVLDRLCRRVVERALATGMDRYEAAFQAAEQSPVGANGLLFDPTFAGGTADVCRKGALFGLELMHSEADILRATLEGIGFELRRVLTDLRKLTPVDSDMLLVGAASRSDLWRQIFADILGVRVHKTTIDRQAAALGACAIAAVGCGLWRSFEQVDGVHRRETVSAPSPDALDRYTALYDLFLRAVASHADIDKQLKDLSRQRKAT